MTKTEQKKIVAAIIKARAAAIQDTANLWDDLDQTDMEMMVVEAFQRIRPKGYKLTTANGRKVRQAVEAMGQ